MPSVQPALWAILVVAGCAGLSALLILLLRPILVRHLLAHPNARSSHQVPTPQGAGLAVMVSVFAGCALGIFLWAQGAEPRLLGVLVAAAGLTLLGAIDDAHTLSVSVSADRPSACGHCPGRDPCPRSSACFPTSCPRASRTR